MRSSFYLLIHVLSRSAAFFLIVGMTTLVLGCTEAAVTSVEVPEAARRDTLLHDPSSVFVFPVRVDSLRVRIDQAADPERRVDIVVDGTLADACTDLHDVRQERHGHTVRVTLLARRPKGALCAQVIRPFRTSIDIDGVFTPGCYTLKVNDVTLPFAV